MSWDGQERRRAREGEVSDTRDLLIRIDERTRNMDERQEKFEQAMFGKGGHDERIRAVEQDSAATKAKSGVIAFVISVLITGIGIFIGKR